ncbi:hypothetical protein O181_065123 [Austropuccinia psidii MF-1]|uniref:Uncharacterized protein n=1 Tax=Austropuccinia psidii MF-1 TaxID=1389203 RepID=A0A9Q3EP56_9BASI|nr:hypothetical protein [Austropuccinia psidii MF-1]
MGVLGKSFQSLRLDLVDGSRQRVVERWTNVGGPIPTGGRPSYSSSDVPISRINNQGVVKRIREISDSPTNPDSEGSEEVEVIHPLVGHPSSSSPTQPPDKEFHSNIIPGTPRNFQYVLCSLPSSVHTPSPRPSTTRPILASPMKPSLIPQPKYSPITTCSQNQPKNRIFVTFAIPFS